MQSAQDESESLAYISQCTLWPVWFFYQLCGDNISTQTISIYHSISLILHNHIYPHIIQLKLKLHKATQATVHHWIEPYSTVHWRHVSTTFIWMSYQTRLRLPSQLLKWSCDGILSMLLCKWNVLIVYCKRNFAIVNEKSVALPLGVSNLATEQPIRAIFAGKVLLRVSSLRS